MLKRRDTKVNFDYSRDALKRFESTSEPPAQDVEDSVEESEEDEGEYYLCMIIVSCIWTNSKLKY